MLWIVISLFTNSASAIILSLLIMGVLLVLSLSPAGEALIRMQLRFKRPGNDEAEVINKALAELLEKVNSSVYPDIYIVEQDIPNAYALGTNTVAVTRGLLVSVTFEELKGVLAHEIGHLENGDTKRRIMALTMNKVGTISAGIMLTLTHILGVLIRVFNSTPIGIVVSLILGSVVAVIRLACRLLDKVFDLSLFAIGRQEEFRADEYAVKCNADAGLISFLTKLEKANFEQKNFWARLHSTHPPVNERINQLRTII